MCRVQMLDTPGKHPVVEEGDILDGPDEQRGAGGYEAEDENGQRIGPSPHETQRSAVNLEAGRVPVDIRAFLGSPSRHFHFVGGRRTDVSSLFTLGLTISPSLTPTRWKQLTGSWRPTAWARARPRTGILVESCLLLETPRGQRCQPSSLGSLVEQGTAVLEDSIHRPRRPGTRREAHLSFLRGVVRTPALYLSLNLVLG